MEAVKIFDEFKLNEINHDWITCVWDTDFIIFEKPPAEDLMFLESQHMRLLLHNTCTLIQISLAHGQHTDHNTEPLSWNVLTLYGVNVQALLAVLGYIMKSGQNQYAHEESREACLSATSLYFILLAVPGSTVFHVYHPNLYVIAVDTFKLSDYLLPATKRRSKSMSLENASFLEDSRILNNPLDSEEAESLDGCLNRNVHDFIVMLDTFWLKHHVQSLDISIQGLLKLLRTGDHTKSGPLAQLAMFALEVLCNDNHGSAHQTIMLVVKYTLPYLLYTQANNHKKYMCTMHQNIICFLARIMHTLQTKVEVAFLVLAQQLMLKCPDRAEPRQKQALVVIKFLSICNENIIIDACKSLIFLSHDARVQNRIFAQEIIGRILVEMHLKDFTQLSSESKAMIEQTLIAIVLSRCIDCSSLVRAKTLAILAEYTDCSKSLSRRIIYQASQPKKALPSIDNLKESLVKCKNVLPGVNTFIGILIHRLKDKSAGVRKSALAIFGNLAQISLTIFEKAIPLISLRCRDPALTVRGLAVQLLSHLLEEFPDNPRLLNAWVKTVVPQIFDVDTKIQQKVLQCFEDLLLNKIVDYSAYNEDKRYKLPWRILITLAKTRMTKSLSKACSVWAKNGTITKTVIKKIQSHIESVNDTAAWILLSALADTMSLPDIEKYISSYRTLFESRDFRANLILQVLRKCWKSLHEVTLKELCCYLLEQLEKFQIDFQFINVFMDIFSEVTEYLHPNDWEALMEERMSDLIRISENEITKMLNCESSTFERSPNSLKAMFTLGHATLFCNRKVSPLVLRILQGILLEQDLLPCESLDTEDLQVFAVVILGQQAISDRDTAQKVVPLFGKLLRQETDTNSKKKAALKINSAKVLADICTRFTALVDPYLPDLCISMKDGNLQIRRTIIIILIKLLLEDFVKMKGPFFFHVLTMLCDSDIAIRELTTFLIEESLLVKNKTLVSQRFVESIFHYNDYQSRQHMGKQEREVLTLPGSKNQDKRCTIYDFMLEHLDPTGKLMLLVKLTKQVLGGVCDGVVDITKKEGACVLKDALYIINNERLQPRSCTRETDEPHEQEESPTHSAAYGMKILVDGYKLHGQETLLPLLVRLKCKISPLKSPLENDVIQLLVKLYQSYNKDQLATLLTEYPTLEKDIENYQRRIEDQKRQNQNDLKEEMHTEEDSPTGRCILKPRVVLHRLTPAQTLKWTGSPEISRAKHISNGSHASLKRPPSLRTNSPKSHTYSISVRSYSSISKTKEGKLSGINDNLPKRRILDA